MAIVDGGIEAQAHQVFRNLRAVMSAAGGSMDDMVKVSILMTNLADFAKVNDIMATYFSKPYPARATYQVAALPRGAMIEIEGTAVVPGAGGAASTESATGWRETFEQTNEGSKARGAGPRSCRPARAPRHRARHRRRAPSSAALRGSHAPRAAASPCSRGLRVQTEAWSCAPRCSIGRGASSCTSLPTRTIAKRSSCCASSRSIRASRRRCSRASACACSATCGPATSASRSCIRSGRRSPRRAAARSAHAGLPDHGRAFAGHAAQARRANDRRRSVAHGRHAARRSS